MVLWQDRFHARLLNASVRHPQTIPISAPLLLYRLSLSQMSKHCGVYREESLRTRSSSCSSSPVGKRERQLLKDDAG
jgi:hypothetical protein